LRPASDRIREEVDAGQDAFVLDAPGLDAFSPDEPDAYEVPDGGPRCPPDPTMRPVEMVPTGTEITNDTTWDCSRTWVLAGNVIVTGGATLTIEASTLVRVNNGGFLLIATDGRLEAVGTASAPIVFTASTRPATRGQWRGIVLLGSARTGFPTTSRVRDTITDGRGSYGGSNDDHDCGRLEYVRVEFAGGSSAALSDYTVPASGLTFAGCGRNTVVDHVQVHRSSDGIGLIGGTIPLLHVVVTDPNEDGIEWVAGYRGLVQFAIVQTFPGSDGALKASRLEGETSGDPESEPTVFNVTLLGAPTGREPAEGRETGVKFQVGSLGWVRNGVVSGFQGFWANVTDAETGSRFASGKVGISHTLFFDRAMAPRGAFPGLDDGDDDAFDEDMFFRGASLSNRFPTTTTLLRAPYNATTPDFTGDSTLTSGAFAPEPAGWAGIYERADYYGAIAPSTGSMSDRMRVDWTYGWTSYPAD
jgi:hypothetical protein